MHFKCGALTNSSQEQLFDWLHCGYVTHVCICAHQVCGGLVWILVASTHVQPNNPLGWVMCVSVFCFVTTFLWFITFACGGHKNRGICSLLVSRETYTGLWFEWAGFDNGFCAQDFLYHLVAAMFYLSASVPLATVTINMRNETAMAIYPFNYYQIDIAAVVSTA